VNWMEHNSLHRDEAWRCRELRANHTPAMKIYIYILLYFYISTNKSILVKNTRKKKKSHKIYYKIPCCCGNSRVVSSVLGIVDMQGCMTCVRSLESRRCRGF